MNDCIFCAIIAGEKEADRIYEDEQTLAFLDINPINDGHTLVIPKVHAKNFLDATVESLSAILVTAKRVAHALTDTLHAEGINLMMNNNRPAGQIVDHAHLHVIPRYSGDGYTHWKGHGTTPKTLATTAEKLRAVL